MSKIYERYDDRITGKIIIRSDIVNISPLLIGKGEGETDTDILLWDDERPYIPASSFAGVLSCFFTRNLFWLPKVIFSSDDERFLCHKIWGKAGEMMDGKEVVNCQSHIVFEDLLPDETAKHKIKFRDGVRIDPRTNIAVTGGKYDYQIVEPEVCFKLKAEITIRNGMDKDTILMLAATIQSIIKSKFFKVGRLGSTGFGEVACRNFNIHYFDFDDKKAADAWLDDYLEDENKLPAARTNIAAFTFKSPETFSINATFKLKSALITGSYSTEKGQPDKSQLKCNSKFVLSGKSIRGALRHRAEKILNTMGLIGSDFNKKWIGYVDNEYRTDKAVKGKLSVSESDLSKFDAMIQQRIKIDRFTGGVITGALFDSAPVWQKNDGTFEISLKTVNPQPAEKALLMHLLKDLWTEDLAIGGEKNVGRGVLVGYKATVSENDTVLAIIEKEGEESIKLTGGDFNNFKDWSIKN